MSDPKSLETRVHRLERRNRYLTAAVVVGAGLLLLGQTSSSTRVEEVSAERFVVRDSSGTARAELKVVGDQDPKLTLHDREGRVRIHLGVSGTEGGPVSLTMRDENGQVRLRLALDAGLPVLALCHDRRVPVLEGFVRGDGAPALTLRDSDRELLWKAP